MSTLIVVLLVGLGAGALIGLQNPLASLLGNRFGLLGSAFVTHLAGTLLAGLILLLFGGGSFSAWRDVPWYAFLAGFVGVGIIAAVAYTVPRIGVTSAVTLMVAGQLVVGAIIDHFGWLGVDVNALTPARGLGFGVLLLGTWLVVR
ncbi:DMT family transporter [Candidatus Bipolaricaulota bacterium]|nr:DMT family transporter [Candidatus Bipolaricaulota bacterium]